VSPNENLNSVALRIGEVKTIIYPSDKLSISKNYVEYTVEVSQKNDGSALSSTLYHGCLAGQLFGGFADQLHYTLRQSQKQTTNKTDDSLGVGSKVLLLCINGVKSDAIIISGIPDGLFLDKDKAKHSSDKGHNLFFEFNGCQFAINKDGEMELKFRGATKHNGELTDGAVKEAEGSTISINKQGNIKVSTPDSNQFVNIDHQNKKIEIQAQTEWNCDIKGTVNIRADNNVFIKSSGVHVGGATDAWMLGTTYRNAETTQNTTLSSSLVSLASLSASAGVALTTASPLNAIPIVGGVAAASFFATAGAALTAAAPQFTAMSTAINLFEGKTATYLSKKNLTD
jgi:hypothetical protein